MTAAEADFQKTVVEFAEILGWRTFHAARIKGHLRTPTSTGFPDLVFAKNGVVLFAELKTDKGRVTTRSNCVDASDAWRDLATEALGRDREVAERWASLPDRADSEDAAMNSVLDWAYWHLARDTTRRVLLGGDDPVLRLHFAPGQLPPGEPARQVAMSILRGSSFEPWDGDPLAGWHRITLGVDARAESESTADPTGDRVTG